VPGILAHPNLNDNRDPTLPTGNIQYLWIMNGWNDFEYNMAAGAASCGVCYWLPAAANSGPSRYEAWRDMLAPARIAGPAWPSRIQCRHLSTRDLVGNACSTAMFSFMEIGQLNSAAMDLDRTLPLR